MAYAREGYRSQPERRIVKVRAAGRADYSKYKGNGQWVLELECGHATRRLLRPRITSHHVVCWDCAERRS